MWSLCHFFFHKNHLYESYLIFVTKWQKNSPPKKKKNCIFLFWEPIGNYSEKMAISSSFFGPENVVTEKMAISSSFFGPENVVTLSLFFSQKSFV